jgi:hypothetical protein
VVRSGQHLALVASQAGCSGAAILSHPGNSHLASRPHPGMLDPDEVVIIPDPRLKHLELASGSAHKVVVRAPSCRLSLELKGFGQAVTSAKTVALAVGPRAAEPIVLERGVLSAPVAVDCTGMTVDITVDGTRVAWTLRPGELRRCETDEGARQRLRNLGYYRAVAPSDDARELRSAVEEFQHDHGLPLTGVLDDHCRNRIAEVYGC